jgi:4-amino-4-deoxy-L-arabinose transferase-like glycosyltransferase
MLEGNTGSVSGRATGLVAVFVLLGMPLLLFATVMEIGLGHALFVLVTTAGLWASYLWATAQRRSAEYDEGRMSAATWPEVRARARRRGGLDG